MHGEESSGGGGECESKRAAAVGVQLARGERRWWLCFERAAVVVVDASCRRPLYVQRTGGAASVVDVVQVEECNVGGGWRVCWGEQQRVQMECVLRGCAWSLYWQ